jgi:hypothetical protein
MFGLTIVQLIGCAAAVVAVLALAAALATASGRDALALLGLRIAAALAAWLERRLSVAARSRRPRE